MKTHILFSPAYATLSVDLDPGESIKAEPGAMVHQSNVDLETGAPGGIFKGLRRMLAKESFFINTFTGRIGGGGGGNVTLAPNTPGDIIRRPMEPGDAILIQAASFLASSSRVDIDTSFQGLRGILGGEGAFFLKASVPSPYPGTVFFNAYGAVQQLDIIDRELIVDTGHLVAFTDKLDYSIGKVGGLRSLIAGGEGLVMKFTGGEGTVWVQTRNLIRSLADQLFPLLPTAPLDQVHHLPAPRSA